MSFSLFSDHSPAMPVVQCLEILAHILSVFFVAYRRIFWTVFLLHSQKLKLTLSLCV